MNAIATSFTPRPLAAETARDRWIFVLVAAIFVLVALGGFVPSSVAKIGAVQAGQRPPFEPIMHVHAAMMGGWLLLLLVQASLMSTGRRVLHRWLGMAGAVLAAAMLISGVLLVRAVWQRVAGMAGAPGVDPAAVAGVQSIIANVLLGQLRTAVEFPLFIGWALWVRRSDPGSHMRFMVLGTAVPMGAAFDRFGEAIGLTTLPGNALSLDLYMLACVLPLFIWDYMRLGRLHPASRTWLIINVPLALAMILLWGSPWWQATAPRLMGAPW